ncbi:MAG: hypothetical protein WDO15_11490 [Bacteroidota bacterium]
MVNNVSSRGRYDAELSLGGAPFKRGKLVITGASRKKISVSFMFGVTTIADDIKTKKVRELLNEQVVMSAGAFNKRVAIRLIDTSVNHKLTINGFDFEFQGYTGSGPGSMEPSNRFLKHLMESVSPSLQTSLPPHH